MTAAPRTPVFGWADLVHQARPTAAGVPGLAHSRATSSGRAALALAMRCLRLPPGAPVLVPTYHCPTMIAAVVAAGCVPRFYALGPDGMPRLPALTPAGEGTPPRAIIVAHLFDRARSLAAVRAWCDEHRLPLIEDCAHAPLGLAGERPAGHWGDLATASLTKFSSAPEMGLLGARLGLDGCPSLAPAPLRDELKGAWDVLDRAAGHGQPAGLAPLVRLLAAVRRSAGRRPADSADLSPALDVDLATAQAGAFASCDMSRVTNRPTLAARALWRAGLRHACGRHRRANHAALLAAVDGVEGVRPLFGPCPEDSVPYAVPLWVDDAERVYAQLRAHGEAVYRWDRVWPGCPSLPGDSAPAWRKHVLQCLCHPGLDTADMQRVAGRMRVSLLLPAALPTGERAA